VPRSMFPLPQQAFMSWCLVKHRDNFTIIIIIIIIVVVVVLLFSAGVEFFEYNPKVSHRRHMCNCQLISGISYVSSRNVYNLSPYKIAYS